jgi:hypothetical protein
MNSETPDRPLPGVRPKAGHFESIPEMKKTERVVDEAAKGVSSTELARILADSKLLGRIYQCAHQADHQKD